MKIDSIRDGVVIDHIKQGRGMRLYELLKLGDVVANGVSVAVIQSVASQKRGTKDIIKIDADVPVNLDVIAYVDPSATVNIIRGGKLIEKKELSLPQWLDDVIKCANPRCITTTEQELKHAFTLADPEGPTYRCLYCETKADLIR